LNPPHPVLQLSRPQGVASYRIQVSSDPGFSDPVVDQAGVTSPSFLVRAALVNHFTYQWRVRPRLDDGTEAGWSQTWSFAIVLPVPTLVTPVPGGSTPTPFPTVSWQRVDGNPSYDIQLGPAADFPNGAEMGTTAETSWKPVSGVPDGTDFSYRVRVVMDGTPGDWSLPGSATVALPPPRINGPSLGDQVHDVTLSWSSCSEVYPWNSYPDIAGYDVELSASPLFPAPGNVVHAAPDSSRWPSGYSGLTWPQALKLQTPYYWRVRATYAGGLVGPWSPSTSFFRDRISRIIRPTTDLGPVSNAWFPLVGTDGTFYSAGGSPTSLLKYDASGQVLSTVPGISPAVVGSDGTVWGRGTGSPAPLVAVAPDGTVKWSTTDIGSGLWGPYVLGPDLTLRGLETTPADYSQTPSIPATRSVVAFDGSGQVKWKFTASTSDWFSMNTGEASLAGGAGGTTYLTAFGTLYALDSSGNRLWTHDVSGAYTLGVVACGHGRVAVSSDRGAPVTVLEADGSAAWTSFALASVTVVDGQGSLYGPSGWSFGGGYQALRSDGVPKWTSTMPGWYPILGDDGTLYLYQNGNEPRVAALSTATGWVLWTTPVPPSSGMSMDTSGNLLLDVGYGQVAVLPTSSHGVDPNAAWPMGGHDPRRTQSVAP
jgi:hypothetical protein